MNDIEFARIKKWWKHLSWAFFFAAGLPLVEWLLAPNSVLLPVDVFILAGLCFFAGWIYTSRQIGPPREAASVGWGIVFVYGVSCLVLDLTVSGRLEGEKFGAAMFAGVLLIALCWIPAGIAFLGGMAGRRRART